MHELRDKRQTQEFMKGLLEADARDKRRTLGIALGTWVLLMVLAILGQVQLFLAVLLPIIFAIAVAQLLEFMDKRRRVRRRTGVTGRAH